MSSGSSASDGGKPTRTVLVDFDNARCLELPVSTFTRVLHEALGMQFPPGGDPAGLHRSIEATPTSRRC